MTDQAQPNTFYVFETEAGYIIVWSDKAPKLPGALLVGKFDSYDAAKEDYPSAEYAE